MFFISAILQLQRCDHTDYLKLHFLFDFLHFLVKHNIHNLYHKKVLLMVPVFHIHHNLIIANNYIKRYLYYLNLCNFLNISPNFLFSELLTFKEDTLDTFLSSTIKSISNDDKELLKQIIIHIDKNY